MAEDVLVREAVERLRGQESPAFFDEFWVRVEAQERSRARRWRALAVAATIAAIGAAAAAGVLAAGGGSNVIDQTLRCPSTGPVFVGASADTPKSAVHAAIPANVLISMTPSSTHSDTLLKFDAVHSGVQLNSSVCRPAPKIPLERSGLPFVAVYKTGYYLQGLGRIARLPGPFVFRVRLVHDDAGVPIRASLALRLVKGAKPVAFITWTSSRVVAYVSRRYLP